MEKAVSTIKGTTITSPYYDLGYKPFDYKTQFPLGLASDSLLFYLALADIYRTEDTYNQAKEHLLEVLVKCQTEEDVQKLKQLLGRAASVGGYAATFYSQNTSILTLQAKEDAKKQLKTIHEKKSKEVEDELDDYDDDFELAMMNFADFCKKPTIDDEDVDYFFGKFLNLKTNLELIHRHLDEGSYSYYRQEIENALQYLRRVDKMIEETNKVWEM